jgi:hypothetical protein
MARDDMWFGQINHFAEKVRPGFWFRRDYLFRLPIMNDDLLFLASQLRPKLAQQSSALR